MSLQRIASRYAKSLIDLSQEQNSLEEVKQDIDSFLDALSNRDFYLLLKSPIINVDKKQSIFKAIFEGKLSKLTMAFFDIILRKNRENVLPEIAREFVHQYKVIKHVTTVIVKTATPLTKESEEAIRQKILNSNATEKNLEIVTEVDPSLIGGFVLEFENKLYDASVAHQLEELKKEFTNNPYISKIVA